MLKILTVSAHLHNINGQGLQTGCLNWVADDSSVFVSCDWCDQHVTRAGVRRPVETGVNRGEKRPAPTPAGIIEYTVGGAVGWVIFLLNISIWLWGQTYPGQPISERAGVLCEFYTHCIFPNQIINSLVGGQIKVHQEEQQLLGCFLSCCVFYRSWAGSLRSPWFSNSWLFEPRWKFLYTLYPASIGWQLRRLWL